MMSEANGMFVPPNTETVPPPPPPTPSLQPAAPSSNTTAWSVPIGGPIGTVVCNKPDLAQMAAKIDSFKKWTLSTYKTTKQSIYENLGKAERTVDKELEAQIESLKDLHRRYNNVLTMSHSFFNTLHLLHETQKSLAESIYQLSLKETALSTQCNGNSECHRSLAHNGELLERSLKHFLSSLGTLCDKTFEDTMQTINNHDQARLEYDVQLHDLNDLRSLPNASPEAVTAAEENFQIRKKNYEKLKEDVKIKMQLLETNRIKVMHEQLVMLQHALVAYFSGNTKDLQAKSKEYGLEDRGGGDCVAPSFLEH